MTNYTMSKYIDAERLKAEIEKRLKNVRDYMNGAGMRYKGPKYYKAQGKESAYDALLSVIDSLQQEQPDFPTTDEQIKEFLATHPKIEVPEKYKNPDWLFKKQEQPEVFDTFEESLQSWKPTEEQMKALLGAEGISRASGYPDNAKVLASLYEDLKKL